MRFLDLVPIEYDRGTEDGRVTVDFEIQEAVAFQEGAASAFSDLEGELSRRDPRATAVVESAIDRLGTYVEEAQEGERVASQEQMEKAHGQASDTLEELIPEEWTLDDSQSDFDLIALTLDRLETAVGAGQYQQAEQARLEAYAFFEFGPELSLRSIAPDITARVEGLVWFGADGEEGLATLIADKKPRRERPCDAARARPGARGRRRRARRGRQRRHRRDQRGGDRLPRGPRGGADPGRGHGQPERGRPPSAAADDDRRRCWPSSPASSPTCWRAPC